MFNDILSVPLDGQLWYIALFAWVVAWKGFALWRAARRGDTWWFVALLVVNTVGILEILYIYVFSRGILSRRTTQDRRTTEEK